MQKYRVPRDIPPNPTYDFSPDTVDVPSYYSGKNLMQRGDNVAFNIPDINLEPFDLVIGENYQGPEWIAEFLGDMGPNFRGRPVFKDPIDNFTWVFSTPQGREWFKHNYGEMQEFMLNFWPSSSVAAAGKKGIPYVWQGNWLDKLKWILTQGSRPPW